MAQRSDHTVLMGVASDSGSEAQESRTGRSHRRCMVVGGTVGLGVASAVVLWRSYGCKDLATPVFKGDSLVILAETYPETLVHLADADDDLDARRRWLEEASDAKAKLAAMLPAGGIDPKLRATIAAAMASDDEVKAKELVQKAMAQAVEQSKSKRRELKAYIKANRRSLTGSTRSPTMQFNIASCVFDVLSLTTTTAGIAANLNDAAKTCWGVKPENLVKFGLTGKAYVHTNVCSVNVWAILGSMLSLSSTLSSAASDCAATMIPNVQALCATAIIGSVTAVAAMGGASTLMKAACHKKGWYHDIMPGTAPSSVGNNEFWIDENPDRKAQYHAEQARMSTPVGPAARRLEEGPAPARQLLFGGGKGSTATQCSVELLGSMWALASAAIAIDSAGNTIQGGSCPPKNFLTGSEKPSNGILYRVPQALCTVDVTGAILGFLSAITYIQLASVNCIDTLNIGAVCGAGVTGLMAAATGLAKAGAAMYIACDVAQKKPLKKTINFARNVDLATGSMLTTAVGALGRRLSDDEALMLDIAEQDIAELQQKFQTPHEALASIGFDIEDKHAPWRNMTVPGMDVNSFDSLTALFKEPEEAASLFGTARCKSE